jgi:glycosyltransferase involved in cell wall biosynthesis
MLISVLTPSYNYCQYIGEALASVTAQRAEPIEHVIADGASTDGTPTLLERYRPAPRWVAEPEDGQSDALNKALASAQGEWIGWLNADEFYLPGALQLVRATIDAHPDADVVFGDCVLVDEHSRLLRLHPLHTFSRPVLRWYGCYIFSCATFIRRSSLPEPAWDSSVDRIMDWDLFLTLAGRGARFVHLPQPLGAYRVHPGQITAEAASLGSDVHLQVRDRHRLPRDERVASALQRVGRALHVGHKVVDRGYLRRRRYAGSAGADLRWTGSEDAERRVARLLDLPGPDQRVRSQMLAG